MNPRSLAVVAAFPVFLTACDKARSLGGTLREKAAPALGEAAGSVGAGESKSSPKGDPELEAVVDRTEEGAIFRKDLPFPPNLQVRVKKEMTFENARVAEASALGNISAQLSGTQQVVSLFEKIGPHVRLTIEKAGIVEKQPEVAEKAPAKKVKPTKLKKEGDDAGAKAPQESPAQDVVGKSAVLRSNSGKWRADRSQDFQTAAWLEDLEPRFASLLVEDGLEPRPLWFGKRRLKPGDEVPLSGDSLSVVFPGAEGSLTLVLERFDHDPQGHPCGVFNAKGSLQVTRMGPAGDVVEASLTVTEGTLWLSLVHPVVLREDLNTVATMKSSARGGVTRRIQGGVRWVTEREWNPGTPEATQGNAG